MKTYSSEPEKDEMYSEAPCDLCGGDGWSLYLPCEGFRFVRCFTCGLVYQNPRPAGLSVLDRYGDNYFSYEIENEANFFNLMLLGLKDAAFHEIETEIFKNAPPRFLDIGCATGRLLEYMKQRGWEEQGVEVCLPSVEYARKERGIRIFHGTLEDAAFPAEYFSVIHGSHVLEHVISPKAFLQEIARILKPGGYAILTTPNVAGWQAKLFGSKWRSAIGDHLYLFSKARAAAFFKAEGFIIEKTKTWGGLAQGMGPKPIKRIMDKAAKVFGTGDVVLFRLKKGNVLL